MANANDRTSSRFCPRCGAFYNNLKSRTCPQCFSRLEVLGDDAAESLSAAIAAHTSDPEAVAAKQAEDERYREQSFGGCLGIAIIGLLTVILSVAIVTAALHMRARPAATGAGRAQTRAADTGVSGSQASVVRPFPYGGAGDVKGNGNGAFPATIAVLAGDTTVYKIGRATPADELTKFRHAVEKAADRSPASAARIELTANGRDCIVVAPSLDRAALVARSLIGPNAAAKR